MRKKEKTFLIYFNASFPSGGAQMRVSSAHSTSLCPVSRLFISKNVLNACAIAHTTAARCWSLSLCVFMINVNYTLN